MSYEKWQVPDCSASTPSLLLADQRGRLNWTTLLVRSAFGRGLEWPLLRLAIVDYDELALDADGGVVMSGLVVFAYGLQTKDVHE